MSAPSETCWTVVRDAAAGDVRARGVFADTYLGVVRAFLAARWRTTVHIASLDDAVQEVFLDLLREGGALTRLAAGSGSGFRAFLFGVARNVALRHEQGAARRHERTDPAGTQPDALPSDAPSMSVLFDRIWARRILQRAAERMRALATTAGPEALRRVELLRLRFQDGLPIREIARVWEAPQQRVHREYARARDEFRHALRAELAFHVHGNPGDVERECAALLELLG